MCTGTFCSIITVLPPLLQRRMKPGTVSLPLLYKDLERVTVGDVNIHEHMLPQPQRSLKVSYILKNNLDIDCVTV